MTDSDFTQLSTFITKRLGIKMGEVKRVMLQSRLQKRLAVLQYSSFEEYIDYVFSAEGQKAELFTMIDLVTTNKTDFFREPVHFDFLKNTAIPQFLDDESNRKNIKIWSAGCSSGEEPYTLGIVMSEYKRLNKAPDFEIFASDLSARILKKASIAIYPEDRISNIPIDLKRRYFLKSKDKEKRSVKVVSELRSKVKYARLNFMDTDYPVKDNFDIIFCRNVLIYFNREIQLAVISKLLSKLKSGGYFFLGHSESITDMDLPLTRIQPTIFRKK
ncbi:MAG: hypothetical protein KAS71_15795 [Bacteroidales bacterium]|nr:hypothetical protein [Bacteroidales bacterium]